MKNKVVFTGLVAKARMTKNADDVKAVLEYGLNNRISVANIRKALNGDKYL